MTAVRNAVPLIRYHGGKFAIADRIIEMMPPHKVYVEPFGGGAGVLLKKRRSEVEVYNDIDGEIVNLFRVVRERGDELAAALEMTPFAREEFMSAYEPSDDPVERARRTVVKAYMGFSSSGATCNRNSAGFRGVSSGANTAKAWLGVPERVRSVADRFRGVYIENAEWEEIVDRFDDEDTLFFVDPPYLPETRSSFSEGKYYRFEFGIDDHVALLERLLRVKGTVMVCGYDNPLYDDMLCGWKKREIEASASSNGGSSRRVETVWLSPNIATGLFA